jgi:hypothetical protein
VEKSEEPKSGTRLNSGCCCWEPPEAKQLGVEGKKRAAAEVYAHAMKARCIHDHEVFVSRVGVLTARTDVSELDCESEVPKADTFEPVAGPHLLLSVSI